MGVHSQMENQFLHHKPVATDREGGWETIIKGVGTNPFDFKRPSREREWKERMRVGESQSLF